MKKIIKKLYWLLTVSFFLSLVIFSWSNWSYGTTYYVSSRNGDDSNDGLSSQTAWKSLGKVTYHKFNASDSILFKRGETWRGQLVPCSGNATGYITYGAYGTGEKPLILGSIEKNYFATWTYKGNNIWAATQDPSGIGEELLSNPSFDKDTSGYVLWYEGGASVYGKRELVEYDSPPAGYRMECRASGSQRNHIQFTIKNIHIIENKFYNLTFRCKATKEFTIDSINLIKSSSPWDRYFSYTRGNAPEIGTEWTTYEVLFLANRTADDGMITFYLGGVLPEGAILSIDTLSFKSCGEFNPFIEDVGNLIFNNEQSCGVKVWNREDLDQQGEFWFDEDNGVLEIYSVVNPASYYSDIECAVRRDIINEDGKNYIMYENLDLRYGGRCGIGGGSTHHIIVRECDLSYIGGGDQYGGNKTVRCGNGIEFWENAHDNIVEGCNLSEIYDAALTNQGDNKNSQYNIYYRNNIIKNSEYSFEYWNRPYESENHDIYFENNICMNAGSGWGHNQRPLANGRHLMFYSNQASTDRLYVRSNIFYNATESVVRVSPPWNGLENLVLDYNCYYQENGILINWQGYNYTSSQFPNYQNDTKKDIHSIVIDPFDGRDTDGDGLSDCDEVREYHTNPHARDTDGDGFSDGVEVAQGSDPTSPSSYPPTTYEDAEDGSITGWSLYDADPAGATISNGYDASAASRVIALSGAGIDNGYQLKNPDGSWWNNTHQFVIQWRMKYSQTFSVYLHVTTDKGPRYLTYKPEDIDRPGDSTYVYHGLGSSVTDGQWHTFTRDLQADLHSAQPDTTLLAVDGFMIRGSGRVDDIVLMCGLPADFDSDHDGLSDLDEATIYGTNPLKADTDSDGFSDGEEVAHGSDPTSPSSYPPTTYENAEDGSITGWSLYDADPAGATISNGYDASAASRVIALSGAGIDNGYQLKNPDGSWWNNTHQFVIQWRMKYSRAFSVYLHVTTDKGPRYLTYKPEDIDRPGDSTYVYHGLGSSVTDGQWHTFTRDLQADLHDAQSDTTFLAVDGFMIRGSGSVDDIVLMRGLPE